MDYKGVNMKFMAVILALMLSANASAIQCNSLLSMDRTERAKVIQHIIAKNVSEVASKKLTARAKALNLIIENNNIGLFVGTVFAATEDKCLTQGDTPAEELVYQTSFEFLDEVAAQSGWK